MKIVKWLDEHFEEYIMIIFLVLIACVMMAQVIFNKAPFLHSLEWAEEFCRFAWIGSVFFSLPYTIRKGSMLRVNVLLDMVPQTVRKIVNLAVDAVTVASMALLAYYSVEVLQGIIESGETSPSMVWPMSIMYVLVLVGFALGALRGVQMFIIHIMHFNEKELSTIEQTMADAAEEAAAGKKAEGGDK